MTVGDHVGVDFGVVENVLYVGVLEDGVAHEFVVGDGGNGGALRRRRYLVLLDLFASEVPVVVYVLSHCSPVFVIEWWRAGCGRPGDAYVQGRACISACESITYSLTLSFMDWWRRVGVPCFSFNEQCGGARAAGHETHEAGGASTGEGPPASFLPKTRRVWCLRARRGGQPPSITPRSTCSRLTPRVSGRLRNISGAMTTFTTAKPMKEPGQTDRAQNHGERQRQHTIHHPAAKRRNTHTRRTHTRREQLTHNHPRGHVQAGLHRAHKADDEHQQNQGRAALSVGNGMDAPAISTWKNAVEL